MPPAWKANAYNNENCFAHGCKLKRQLIFTLNHLKSSTKRGLNGDILDLLINMGQPLMSNTLFLLVPPAGIEPAAHGLGIKKTSNPRATKVNEGFYYIKWFHTFSSIGHPWTTRENRRYFWPFLTIFKEGRADSVLPFLLVLRFWFLFGIFNIQKCTMQAKYLAFSHIEWGFYKCFLQQEGKKYENRS